MDAMEDFVSQTHASIMEALRGESESLRHLSATVERERIPNLDTLNGITFDADELEFIISKIFQNDWDGDEFEQIFAVKMKKATEDFAEKEELKKKELKQLRAFVTEQDLKFKQSRNIAHNANVEASESNIDDQNDKEAHVSRSYWQRISGNAVVPKYLRHHTVLAEEVEESPYFLSIPFKPVIWRDICRADKNKALHDENLFKRNSETMDSAGHHTPAQKAHPTYTDHAPQPLDIAALDSSIMDEKYTESSFEEFVRSIPWFHAFMASQIEELTSALKMRTFSDSEPIIAQGQPLMFCMIKQGQVLVTKKESSHRPVESIRRMYSGEVFGFEFTSLEDQNQHHPAMSEYAYSAIGEVVIYSCPADVLQRIIFHDLAINGDDGQTEMVDDYPALQYAELGLCLDSNTLKLQHEPSERTIDHSVLQLKRMELLLAPSSSLSLTKKHKLQSTIFPLCVHSIDFREIAEELIARVRDLFQVDRFGVYILDRVSNMMHLFTSHVSLQDIERGPADTTAEEHQSLKSTATASPQTNKSTGFKVLTGIRMPLKGIAAHVAQHNQILNLEDCYKSVLFDSAMDIRTGYRSKQMLCVPVQDSFGQAIGVLQFINPLSFNENSSITPPPHSTTMSVNSAPTPRGGIASLGVKFTLSDEELSSYVASLFAPQVYALQKKLTSFTLPIPSHTLMTSVKLQLQRLESVLDNRHVKYTLRFVEDGRDIVPARSSSSVFAMNPVTKTRANTHEKTMKCCDFNEHLDSVHLLWSDLPRRAKLIVELFSTNDHATGWAFLDLFDDQQRLQFGAKELLVLSGACPSDWNAVCKLMELHDLYAQYRKKGGFIYDHVIYSQLDELFVGRLLLDLLLKLNKDHAVVAFEERAPVPFVSCSFSHKTKSDEDDEEGEDDSSGAAMPSLTACLLSLALPNEKQQQLIKFVFQNNLNIPWQTSSHNMYRELRETLWQLRDVLLQNAPSSALFPLFSAVNQTLSSQVLDTLLSVFRVRDKLRAVSVLPLLDGCFASSPKVQCFALSALTQFAANQWLDNETRNGDKPCKMTAQEARVPLLEHVLFTVLLTILNRDSRESPLLSFFLWLVMQFPSSIGVKSFWYLRAFLQPCGRISVAQAPAMLLLRDVLRLLPQELKIKLSNGWELVQTFVSIHQEEWTTLHEQQSSISSTVFAQRMRDRLRSEYARFGDASHSPPPVGLRGSSVPIGHEFLLPGFTLQECLAREQESLSLTHSHLSSAIMDVDGDDAVGDADTNSKGFAAVKDIAVGGHVAKEPSFTVWASTTAKNRAISPLNSPGWSGVPLSSSGQTIGGLVFVADYKWRADFLMSQLNHAMNAIFLSDGLTDLHITSCELFSLAQPHMEFIATRSFKNSVAINALLVEAIQQHNKEHKPSAFTFRKNDQSMNKIPNELLINFFETHSKHRKEKDDARFVENFLHSLAGYLLSSHVLALNGVNAINTLVTHDAELFVQSPSQILGLDVAAFYDQDMEIPTSKNSKRQPIFFLPCMAMALGGPQHPFFRVLMDTVKQGFLSLRRECSFLLWTLKSMSTYLRLPQPMIIVLFGTLRETLMLEQNDTNAVRLLEESLMQGLNADYKLKFRRN